MMAGMPTHSPPEAHVAPWAVNGAGSEEDERIHTVLRESGPPGHCSRPSSRTQRTMTVAATKTCLTALNAR